MPSKIDKINASIKKTNKDFKKATEAQKRVLIAKDVLNQIKAKRYNPEPGVWVELALWSGQSQMWANPTESIQKMFADKTIAKCNVCALGGLFMSCTNLNNNTNGADFHKERCFMGSAINRGDRLSYGLNTIFSSNQLELIEIYFESGDGYFGADGVTGQDIGTDRCHVVGFSEKYPDADDRLREIMKNIIDNDGRFVPSKLKIAKIQ